MIMAQNITGISRDLIFHPGETLQEILENKGVSQKELAMTTGFSEAFISNVLSGKKDISAKFATKLEYALGIESSFFMRLQAHYDNEIAKFEELNNITEEEKSIVESLKEIPIKFKKEFDFSNSSDYRIQVSQLREFLRVGNLQCLESFAECRFRIDSSTQINKYALGAWVRIAENFTRETPINTIFDSKKINEIVDSLKNIMNGPSEDIVDKVKLVFAENGIAFEVIENIKGAPVQGYLGLREDGVYQMVLTIRKKFADIFWFSLFHELGHLYYNDLGKKRSFIDICDYDDKYEHRASTFASDMLIDPKLYRAFINNCNYDIKAINEFAKRNNVQPYIIIGRLQRENEIPYSMYSEYKARYKLS